MIITIEDDGLEVTYEENCSKIRVKDPKTGILYIGDARKVECETRYPYGYRFMTYPIGLERHYKIIMDVKEVKQ